MKVEEASDGELREEVLEVTEVDDGLEVTFTVRVALEVLEAMEMDSVAKVSKPGQIAKSKGHAKLFQNVHQKQRVKAHHFVMLTLKN